MFVKSKPENEKTGKTASDKEKKVRRGLFGTKKVKPEPEPQYFRSAINTTVDNYRVYYLTQKEKNLYFLVAFLVGAFVGYTFYGGIGKNEFGEPTLITYVLNTIVSVGVGILFGKAFLPIRQEQILKKRKKMLRRQFRDMLECFSTALGAGKNAVDSFASAYEDMKNQYEEGAFILNELKVITIGTKYGENLESLVNNFGMRSGIPDIEDFANVFEISNRTGVNLKDVIRNTYDILSDKMQISEEIETMITGSKSELNLLLVLPVAMVMLIKNSSPDFSANFTTLPGIVSTTIAIVFTVCAYLIGRKIMDFGE